MLSGSIKDKLYHLSDEFLSSRIMVLENGIMDSRKSSWEDTKSSAGDKYETSREMIQGEISQNQRQLEEAKKLLSTLEIVKNTNSNSELIIVGSLVKTNQGNFFLGIPVGMVELEGISYALISSSSPIGLQLLGKKVGDRFKFLNKDFMIERIE